MKHPFIRAALSAAAVVGLLALSVTSAQADATRQLPSGDKLFALSCEGSAPDGQVFSVEPATGDLTAVGEGSEDASGCFAQAAWNPVTKTAYAVDWRQPTVIVTVGADGVSSDAHAITYDGSDIEADSLAISPAGIGYVTDGSSLYIIALTGENAGELTYVGDTGAGNTYGLAFSLTGPTAGTLYGVTTGGNLFEISTEDGSTGDALAHLDLTPGSSIYSLQVASNGIIWLQNYAADNFSDLWTVDPSAGDAGDIADSALRSSAMNLDGVGVDTESLLIIPADATVLPTITTASTLSVLAGNSFSFTPAATATPAAVFTYTGTLPAGVTFVDGVLSGTIAAAGTYAFTFVATNDAGATPQTFTITVTAGIVLPITAG